MLSLSLSVYDYTASRNRDGPERFLKGFQGYLQADAFSGYDRLCAGLGVTEVACWAHARRKFYDARTTAPELAHEALARIGQLYEVERRAKEWSAAERTALRHRLLPTTPSDNLAGLLPDIWFQTHPNAARKRAA